MDFMKLLRSLEDFVYEVMTWLVFYPKTLWMVLRHPVTLMRYSDAEQAKPEEDQYLETLNPVLFLMLTLLIAHGAELSVKSQLTPIQLGALTPFLQSDINLLLMRGVIFAIFPLLFAVTVLRRRKLPLDRKTLKGPFLAQCFTAAVFAGLLDLSILVPQLGRTPLHTAFSLVLPVTFLWYLAVQSTWLAAQLEIGRGRAALMAIWVIFQGLLVSLAALLLLNLT